ncbi:MAG: hypothetical protein ACOC6B_04865 [Thermodesulfobacteriota bacterium]
MRSEIEYLMGEIDLCEAAEQVGISSEAFRKRLDRHKVGFKEAVFAMDDEQ